MAFRDGLLTPKHAHFLAAAVWGNGRKDAGQVGFAFLDASTGEFYVTEEKEERFDALLQSVGPAEILVDKAQKSRVPIGPWSVTEQEDWAFGYDFAYETLLRHFQTHSLKGFGVEAMRTGLAAAGAALYYLGETQKGRVPHIRRLQRYHAGDFLSLDSATKRNLELVGTLQGGGRDGSLIGVLDATLTPMGGRLLRTWLVRPLRDVAKIRQRLDAVAAFVESARLRRALREELRLVGDLERLVGKVCTGRAQPRDLVTLGVTLRQVPTLQALLDDEETAALAGIRDSLAPCQDVVERIRNTLTDEPPAKTDAGGFIRDGFDSDLDELRQIARSGKTFLAQLQADESRRTGIPSLKIGYNKVFGYYLEVTHTHTDKVPDTYIRKQTLTNAERYVTPELKEFEEKILTAEERIAELEQSLFETLRTEVADSVEPIQHNARLLAMLDVFAGFAEVAERNSYVCPEVDDSAVLEIDEGRHPVVEKALPAGEPFIPNSVHIAALEEGAEEGTERAGQIHVITGPNMAGKSVVLRQTGLIVLLAQVGSFVPAARARIGAVDAIFTRVGASDNLAAGESTFLVEMNETANILNNATPRSLVLLDEVGRGTSTFDGLSIAWAIIEHLHEHPERAARTLFATHYHELNALAGRLARVKSFRVQVQEHEGRVVFLRRLAPGAADHSYGIEVARMAGLPSAVVRRAKEVLAHLEEHDVAGEVGVRGGAEASLSSGDGLPAPGEATLVNVPAPSATPESAPPHPTIAELLDRLETIDPNGLTPVEALLALAELKDLAER